MNPYILFGLIACCLTEITYIPKAYGKEKGPPCDWQKSCNKIDLIESRLRELKEKTEDSCKFHGQDYRYPYDVVDPEKHTVCRSATNSLQKVFVEAHLTVRDLGMGTRVDENSRQKLLPFQRVCGCEHMGHIIAKEQGGIGEEWNLFVQSAQLNMGKWTSVTDLVTKHLQEQQKEETYNYELYKKTKSTSAFVDVTERRATMIIGFEFDDDDIYARPTQFFYKFTLYVDETNEKNKVIKTIYGKFHNYDYTDAGLKFCRGPNGAYLYFAYFSIEGRERFEARKTCDIEDKYKKLFVRPLPSGIPE